MAELELVSSDSKAEHWLSLPTSAPEEVSIYMSL